MHELRHCLGRYLIKYIHDLTMFCQTFVSAPLLWTVEAKSEGCQKYNSPFRHNFSNSFFAAISFFPGYRQPKIRSDKETLIWQKHPSYLLVLSKIKITKLYAKIMIYFWFSSSHYFNLDCESGCREFKNYNTDLLSFWCHYVESLNDNILTLPLLMDRERW